MAEKHIGGPGGIGGVGGVGGVGGPDLVGRVQDLIDEIRSRINKPDQGLPDAGFLQGLAAKLAEIKAAIAALPHPDQGLPPESPEAAPK